MGFGDLGVFAGFMDFGGEMFRVIGRNIFLEPVTAGSVTESEPLFHKFHELRVVINDVVLHLI